MEKIIGVIDEPVRPGEDDNLGIEIHSKSLIEFIQETKTPITVGIQGEWGSGKTSLLNSIHYTFETEQPTFKQIWINSWEYSLLSTPEEALLKIVNRIIDQLLESDTNKKYKQKITASAKRIFKGALRIGAQVALGDEAAQVTGELMESGNHSISELRKNLEGLVVEIAKQPTNIEKIIIYVDDLDRIEPKNAVAILELMKNIFNVHNCVFILAIDFQVVVKGLEHKFGKQTHENEWEFRAFFDKIIQLPFMMPMSQYNIGKYINKLLVDTGFFEGDELDTDEMEKIILWTIGGNPRSIKRLVNSVSLIQIFMNNKDIMSNVKVDDNHETSILSEKENNLLIFSFLCVQIAYPLVYSLLVEEPDFVKWDDALAFRKTQRSEENIEAFKGEFEKAQVDEDFHEEWEKFLYRICYERPRLKPRTSDISRFFSYIKEELLKNSQKSIGTTIAYILTQTSVTSVSSTAQGQTAKTNFGKPSIDYLKEISEQIGEEEEITKEELKKKIKELIKKESGEDILPDTLTKLLSRATINDNNRWNFPINEKNMEKYNVFYFVDENNKRESMLKKFSPDKPPTGGYKIYYKKKDTNERVATDPTKIRNQFDQKLN